MKIERYLIVGKTERYAPTARITSGKPSLNSHEVAVFLSLDIPDSLFERPQLSATLSIPASSVGQTTIDAAVVDNIHGVVQRELGIDLNISLPEIDVAAADAEVVECQD